MRVVTVTGRARSGKDTFATLLKHHLSAKGNRVLITHYADMLKYICRQYLGWDGKKDEAGRKLLQTVGTEVFREFNQNYWVNHLVTILYLLGGNWDFVIIPDARFFNEVETMRQLYNGFAVKIVRDVGCGLSDEARSHISETQTELETTRST